MTRVKQKNGTKWLNKKRFARNRTGREILGEGALPVFIRTIVEKYGNITHRSIADERRESLNNIVRRLP